MDAARFFHHALDHGVDMRNARRRQVDAALVVPQQALGCLPHLVQKFGFKVTGHGTFTRGEGNPPIEIVKMEGQG